LVISLEETCVVFFNHWLDTPIHLERKRNEEGKRGEARQKDNDEREGEREQKS
jgi:hypothetical protein